MLTKCTYRVTKTIPTFPRKSSLLNQLIQAYHDLDRELSIFKAAQVYDVLYGVGQANLLSHSFWLSNSIM